MTLQFFHLSKLYLDEKLLRQCFSYFNCRLLGIMIMGLCLNVFSIGQAAMQGVREKYLTAKGVRSPKSLGTAGLQYTVVKIAANVGFLLRRNFYKNTL